MCDLDDAMCASAVTIIQLEQIGAFAQVTQINVDFHAQNILSFHETTEDVIDADALDGPLGLDAHL